MPELKPPEGRNLIVFTVFQVPDLDYLIGCIGPKFSERSEPIQQVLMGTNASHSTPPNSIVIYTLPQDTPTFFQYPHLTLHQPQTITNRIYQPQVRELAVKTGGFHCIKLGSMILFGFNFCFSFIASCRLMRCVGNMILCSPL